MRVWSLVLAATANAGEVFDMDAEAPPATPTITSAPATKPAEDDGARDMDSGTGELASSVISAVLKKGQWAIQDCASRLGGAGFSGRMVVEWEITESGTVQNVRTVETNVRNPPFETCVFSAVKRLKFTPPVGGTVITTHPFVFQL